MASILPLDAFGLNLTGVDINSRFVCKSPIHKLVNQLAKEFEYVNARRSNNGLQKSKRSRSCAGPAYILKLSCPRSLYDLSFEHSKTCVQFKVNPGLVISIMLELVIDCPPVSCGF